MVEKIGEAVVSIFEAPREGREAVVELLRSLGIDPLYFTTALLLLIVVAHWKHYKRWYRSHRRAKYDPESRRDYLKGKNERASLKTWLFVLIFLLAVSLIHLFVS